MLELHLTNKALEDLTYWVKQDRKLALKVLLLLDEITKTPFEGTGKPEPLKYALQGCWSRRLTGEHRLVYKVEKQKIIVLACRYHY
ncbi:MAG: Txe/YoeB family addiction module toxin [bacterium]